MTVVRFDMIIDRDRGGRPYYLGVSVVVSDRTEDIICVREAA
jgi:hypothetical protein